MKLAGRLSAAIEILSDIETHHAPAKTALANWGRTHRFAGSKDRAAIGNLVYDVLRNKSSLAWQMQSDTPRSLTLAAVTTLWSEDPNSFKEAWDGDKFAPEPLSDDELKALTEPREETAPPWIAANIPEWLYEQLNTAFGDDLLNQTKALSDRAPIDVRTNANKTEPEKLAKALKSHNAETTVYAPFALRIAPVSGPLKAPNIEVEGAHGKGWFEVQDEGSQIACLLTGAKSGDQVLDYCAGAGGKTLALSAQMENKGQIHAYDNDKHRLRPIFERLKRAGCRNVQTLEAGNEAQLEMLDQTMDIVLVDAPCTGTGTWRRHPDAKWRLSEKSLEDRLNDQRTVLEGAARYVEPGGILVYVTCSLLPVENTEQIAAFLEKHSEFEPVPYTEQWQQSQPETPLESAIGDGPYLTLTPASHGTDGFFIAILKKTK